MPDVAVADALFGATARPRPAAGMAGDFELCASEALSAERLDVLSRAKFSVRLARAGLAPVSLVSGLRKLAVVVAAPTTTIMGLPRHRPAAPT